MIINLQQAHAMLGERSKMSGEDFCAKYKLTPIPNRSSAGRSPLWLFDEDEVERASIENYKQEMCGRRYPVDSGVEYIVKMVNSINEKINAVIRELGVQVGPEDKYK